MHFPVEDSELESWIQSKPEASYLTMFCLAVFALGDLRQTVTSRPPNTSVTGSKFTISLKQASMLL